MGSLCSLSLQEGTCTPPYLIGPGHLKPHPVKTLGLKTFHPHPLLRVTSAAIQDWLCCLPRLIAKVSGVCKPVLRGSAQATAYQIATPSKGDKQLICSQFLLLSVHLGQFILSCLKGGQATLEGRLLLTAFYCSTQTEHPWLEMGHHYGGEGLNTMRHQRMLPASPSPSRSPMLPAQHPQALSKP